MPQREHTKILTQSDPTPVELLSVADISWQIVAERSQIAQWSQWRAYRKIASLFRIVRWTNPYDLSFPEKMGSQMHPRDIEFRMVMPI